MTQGPALSSTLPSLFPSLCARRSHVRCSRGRSLALLSWCCLLIRAGLAHSGLPTDDPHEVHQADNVLAGRLRQPVIKAAGGRFVLTGANPALVQAVARWAEETTDGLSRWTGYNFDFAHRVLTVSLEAAAPSGQPAIVIGQEWDGRRLLQRICLRDVEKVDRESAEEALGFLLLQGDILLRQRAAGSLGQSSRPAEIVPRWLVEGLVQNLDPARRARNAEQVLDRWVAGRFSTLRSWDLLLAPSGFTDLPPYPSSEDGEFRRAVAGVFTAWFFYHLRGRNPLETILEELVQNRPVTVDWMVRQIRPGLDADAEWDAWLLRQKRTVHLPGQATRTTLDQIRAAVLLFSPDSGMRELNRGGRIVVLPEDLIGERKDRALREACRAKAMELHLLAAGRGEEARAAAEAYARFFESVAEGSPPRRLRRRLAEADAALRALERRISTSPQVEAALPETVESRPAQEDP